MELNIFADSPSYLDGSGVMTQRNKNERVELDLQIMKYRELLFRIADEQFLEQAKAKITELERKLREIDE
jgi:hypothetical protein